MGNMDIYEKARSVPKEAIKQIVGGRLKGMSDINPMWRLKMLTELFGPCGIGWKVEIIDKRLERGHGEEIVCFVDINLYVKDRGEWSAAIPGMGGSSFVTQERSGLYTNDECFKMALTDAISIACKSLGFAADIYFANDKTKYDTPTQTETAITEQPKANVVPVIAPKPALVPTIVPPPTKPGPKPISPGQIKFIKTLIHDNVVPEEVYREMIAPKESTSDLSSFEATKIIDKLKNFIPF